MEHLATLILRNELVDTVELARQIASHAEGSIEQARLLADVELVEFRANLLQQLSSSKIDIVRLASGLSGIADAAGKEAAARRDRLRLVLSMAAEFFQALTLAIEGAPTAGDPLLRSAVASAREHFRPGVQGAIACWRRCLEGIEQIERNANQTALVEAWSASMSALSKR